MSNSVERMSKWFYRGLWGILTKWFCVPDEPPTLPASAGEFIRAFRPSDGFLRYLKFQFWLALVVIDVAIIVAWVVVMIALLWLGVLLAPVFLVAMIAPNIVAYLAVHLRYDTTWYVISDRSMRIRRGIWIIHDTTITFENVQNVTVNQGPLQRFFRIADVIVQTAGGGGSAHSKEGASLTGAHHGLIEGIDNAQEIRDLILSRLQKSRSAGLGDEEDESPQRSSVWTSTHLQCLREIRDAASNLVVRS
jgi:membrane protein YdbS with pleckstrin-like domain